jgi:hypothetical protein
MAKTETFCSGSPCDSGNTIYTTTHKYDEHRRPCLVESVNAAGAVILASSFRYDQYNNVVHEESRSDLVDPSDAAYDDSNYQIDYTYDGLLRMIEENRTDLAGSLIKDTTYQYDAASNLIEKDETVPAVGGPEVTATPTATVTDTPMATATPPPNTPTPTATAPGKGHGGGCQIQSCDGGSCWTLLLPLSLLVLRRRRRMGKELGCEHSR